MSIPLHVYCLQGFPRFQFWDAIDVVALLFSGRYIDGHTPRRFVQDHTFGVNPQLVLQISDSLSVVTSRSVSS